MIQAVQLFVLQALLQARRCAANHISPKRAQGALRLGFKMSTAVGRRAPGRGRRIAQLQAGGGCGRRNRPPRHAQVMQENAR